MASAIILLNRGYVAIVDSDDFDAVAKYNWNVLEQGRCRYAHTVTEDRRIVTMHRFLFSPPSPFVVDHINGNGLDNRKCNLRAATIQQNAWNHAARQPAKCASPYKGVWFATDGKRRKRWVASIRINGKRIRLGYFATDFDAALAYDEAAQQHFGEFAKLNFGNSEIKPDE